MSSNLTFLPRRHYLDRRAARLVEDGSYGNPDDLLNTRQVADWLGISSQWLEIGRSKGFGPPFIRLNSKRIRYLRAAVLRWLEERTHARTAEYKERQRGQQASADSTSQK
jgi:predicted DNA-binding transcriptional regulator AlpA